MRVVVMAALVGCGFEHGVSGTPGPNDGAPPEGVVLPVDARPIDARPVDAAVSQCPDDDLDGVCNNVDDWPCGAKPTSAAATVSFSNNNGKTNTTVSMTNLGNTGRFAVAAANANVSLAVRLQITDTACGGNCVDQLEVGWVNPTTNTGNRLACVFDQQVSKSNGLDAAIATTIRAPTTPQVYDLRVNLGQDNFCGDNANNWWGNTTPGATRTIAKLCVH